MREDTEESLARSMGRLRTRLLNFALRNKQTSKASQASKAAPPAPPPPAKPAPRPKPKKVAARAPQQPKRTAAHLKQYQYRKRAK